MEQQGRVVQTVFTTTEEEEKEKGRVVHTVATTKEYGEEKKCFLANVFVAIKIVISSLVALEVYRTLTRQSK